MLSSFELHSNFFRGYRWAPFCVKPQSSHDGVFFIAFTEIFKIEIPWVSSEGKLSIYEPNEVSTEELKRVSTKVRNIQV